MYKFQCLVTPDRWVFVMADFIFNDGNSITLSKKENEVIQTVAVFPITVSVCRFDSKTAETSN